MATPEPQQDDLMIEIRRYVNLGHNDPVEIAKKVAKRRGRDWIVEELWSRHSEIIAGYARDLIGAQRNATLRSVAAGDVPRATTELQLRTAFVPSGDGGYTPVKIGQMTAADHRAVAAVRRNSAAAMLRVAEWHETVADMMDAAGVSQTCELSVLPEMPGEGEDLAA